MSNGFRLFGYRIGKEEDTAKKAEDIASFAPPSNEDGAFEFAPGGSYGTFVDLEGTAKNEAELVTKYRELALQSEVETALEDIVNEAITYEDFETPIELDLTDVKVSEKVKERIREEFQRILELMDFSNKAHDIFRRWYIDGRIYYHMMISEKSPGKGIQELRYIDPRRIRKVREAIRKPPTQPSPVQKAPAFKEYYMYTNPNPTFGAMTTHTGVRIAKDSIAYAHSGLMDAKNRMVLSYLHKAIKPMNQLRMLEDATVIYRLSRAPERRIFYIDVGNLPKMKAEQYIRDMMVKHKNRLVYDASTGEVRDDRKFMTMLEDFWLPRREGGRGTEITTLPGGQNLGEMEDVEYFRRKLFRALNVPVTRIQAETTFSLGRGNEITRDEVKFSKFISRLRMRFASLFDELLRTQLLLRGVLRKEEWQDIKEQIHYDFRRDNYYAELKEQEITTARMTIAQNFDPFVGKYVSAKYIREKILKLTDEEIVEIDKEIEEERQKAEAAQQEQMMVQQQTGQAQPPDRAQQQPQAQAQPVREEEELILQNVSRLIEETLSNDK